MNPNERISKIIEYSGLTSSEFADEIDVQRSSISHITSGRNKPSLDFLIKVKERVPELQWDWLIKGDGEMLIEPEKAVTEPADQQKPSTASLPDLFSLIDDDDFGITESEDRIQKEIPEPTEISKPREFPKPYQTAEEHFLNDSQRLADEDPAPYYKPSGNQSNKVKRIVLFYENGKFESFEP